MALVVPLAGVRGEAVPAAPATTPFAHPGPHIQFAEPAFDFGKVAGGEVVKHDFFLTNTGDQLLVIRDIQTTCGCTIAKTWSREIPPGKSGTIAIDFHTVNFSGPVAKSVTVNCNDTNHAAVTLQIKGTVWRPIEFTPPAANFVGALDSLSNISRSIKIMNRDEPPLTLSPPETSHRAIVASLQTNQPGQEFTLQVSLVGPLGAGNLFGEVTLKTSNSNMPVLKVPVYSVFRPAVMLLPLELEIPGGHSTNKLTRTVSIRNNSATALKLSDPTINTKGVAVDLHELLPGQLFSIVLTFPEGFEATKGERLELTFKSNNPEFALLKVPIVSH